jgi:hypothetical protein
MPRRYVITSAAGLLVILLFVGAHFLIQRQLQAPTAAPAPSPTPVQATPTTLATMSPTVQPLATATQTPRPTTPQPTNTPAPPPTNTPTPGPIVTNDKLGVGVYTNGLPINVLRTMRPAMILVQNPEVTSMSALRQVFPKALLVGRQYFADGDPNLAHCSDASENHEAKGGAFADTIARTALPMKGIVDAWVGDNEQTDHNRPQDFPCHAQFQAGFVEELQGKYGIAAVSGNDASGAIEPGDYPKYFAKSISEAIYFGVHAYSKPEARSMQTGDAQFYALRYRLIHDALVQAGVALPKGGFLLTESGLYEGWRGFVDDQKMANDFIWLEQETEKDSYLKGQFVFGIGPQKRFGNYEIAGTTLLELMGQFNAQHAGKP